MHETPGSKGRTLEPRHFVARPLNTLGLALGMNCSGMVRWLVLCIWVRRILV